MSRFTKSTITKGSLALGSVVVVLAIGAYAETILKVDPFAGMKRASKDLDPKLGVRIEGLKLQSYDKSKLVSKAEIDRMDIGQDKKNYDLFGVHNGKFFGDKGTLQFDGPRATWNVGDQQMEAPFGGRIKTKDADLKVPSFNYRSDSGQVHVPSTITGSLYKGKVKAQGVDFNINSNALTTGPVVWQGQISQQEQQDAGGPTNWQIHGATMSHKGNVLHWTQGVADDGEIIVSADLIDWDRTTDVVTATGHVKYISAKADMICDKAVIVRKEHKATMTGSVQMLIKKKESQAQHSADEEIPPFRPIVPEEIAKSRPRAQESGQTDEQKKLDDQIRSGKNVRNYNTLCYADQVIYWYKKGERHAVISGHPQARQELDQGAWRQVWTNTAYYDGEKDLMRLVSSEGQKDTRMINSIGDDFVATEVSVSTKDGDDSWDADHPDGVFVDYTNEIKSTTSGSDSKSVGKPPANVDKTGGGDTHGKGQSGGGR